MMTQCDAGVEVALEPFAVRTAMTKRRRHCPDRCKPAQVSSMRTKKYADDAAHILRSGSERRAPGVPLRLAPERSTSKARHPIEEFHASQCGDPLRDLPQDQVLLHPFAYRRRS